MALACLVCLGSIGAVFAQNARSEAHLAEVDRMLAIRRQSLRVLSILQDAETGQRGYLLTGSGTYLAPYESALRDYAAAFADLSALVADDPAQARAVAAMQDIADLKLAELAATIRLQDSGDRPAALRIIDSDAGLRLMTRLRDETAALVDGTEARLLSRAAAMRRTDLALSVALLAALAGALLVAALGLWLMRRDLMQSRAHRAELAALNAGLDARVRARTAELDTALAVARTERDRVELLMREVDHRVGNSLAMISSLLGMERRTARSAESRAILDTARGRIRALGAAQRRFRLEENLTSVRMREALENLVRDFELSGQAPGVIFETDIAPLSVDGRDAVSLAVIANELIVNALKHGIGPGQPGRIGIAFARDPQAGHAILTVANSGAAWAPEDRAPATGTKVIAMLAAHLGGETRIADGPDGGTVVAIAFHTLGLTDDSSAHSSGIAAA